MFKAVFLEKVNRWKTGMVSGRRVQFLHLLNGGNDSPCWTAGRVHLCKCLVQCLEQSWVHSYSYSTGIY